MNIKMVGAFLAVCVAAVISLAGCAPPSVYSQTCKSSTTQYDKLLAYTDCEINTENRALAKELGLEELLVPSGSLVDSVVGIGELATSCLVVVVDAGEGLYFAIIQSRYDDPVNSVEIANPTRLTASMFSSLMDDYRSSKGCNQLTTT